MTEATAETPTLTEVLVRHGIYDYRGMARIAVDDNTLQDITGTQTYTVTPAEVTLLEAPGSPEWVDRMVRARGTLVRNLETARSEVAEKTDYIVRLGEAMLAAAIENSLCEQYDAFARDWGLPTREREYTVTMTVLVTASDEYVALDLVKDCVSIDRWTTTGIDDDPEYYVSEA